MKNDWAAQWFKLAGKCMAWVAGIAILLTFCALPWVDMGGFALLLPFGAAIYACFYASIPVAIFTSFIIALRAFGRNQ